jgi:hypothetical protein
VSSSSTIVARLLPAVAFSFFAAACSPAPSPSTASSVPAPSAAQSSAPAVAIADASAPLVSAVDAGGAAPSGDAAPAIAQAAVAGFDPAPPSSGCAIGKPLDLVHMKANAIHSFGGGVAVAGDAIIVAWFDDKVVRTLALGPDGAPRGASHVIPGVSGTTITALRALGDGFVVMTEEICADDMDKQCYVAQSLDRAGVARGKTLRFQTSGTRIFQQDVHGNDASMVLLVAQPEDPGHATTVYRLTAAENGLALAKTDLSIPWIIAKNPVVHEKIYVDYDAATNGNAWALIAQTSEAPPEYRLYMEGVHGAKLTPAPKTLASYEPRWVGTELHALESVGTEGALTWREVKIAKSGALEAVTKPKPKSAPFEGAFAGCDDGLATGLYDIGFMHTRCTLGKISEMKIAPSVMSPNFSTQARVDRASWIVFHSNNGGVLDVVKVRCADR